MTRKEAILKIKTLLTATFADESTEGKAEDATTGKLSDGTMVEFSKLEVGGDLSIVAADGVKAPAPIGEYEMEDGTVVSVTEVGKIAAITESGAPKEAEVAAVSAEIATLKAEFKAITEAQAALIVAQAAEIATFKAAFDTFKANTGAVLTQFHEVIEVIGSEESGEPAAKPKETVFTKKEDAKKVAREAATASFNKFATALKDKK